MSNRVVEVTGVTRRNVVFAWTVFGLTAVLCVLLAARLLPLGVRGEWAWEYGWTGTLHRVWAPLGVFAILALSLWRWTAAERDKGTGRVWPVLLKTMLLGYLLQLAVASLSGIGLRKLTLLSLVPWASGYFTVADGLANPWVFMRTFSTLIPSLPPHVSTHPPGAVLFFYGINSFFDRFPGFARTLLDFAGRSDFDPRAASIVAEGALGFALSDTHRAGAFAAGLLIPAIAALTVLPVYVLGRETLGHRAGLLAAASSVVVPGLLLFTPGIDEMFAPVAAGSIALALVGLKRSSVAMSALGGILMSVGLLFSYCFLALLPAVGVLWLGRALSSDGGTRGPLVRAITAFLAGLAGTVLAVKLATGFDLVSGLRAIRVWSENARTAGMSGGAIAVRTYWKWVPLNLVDFALFLGLPFFFLAVRGFRGFAGVNRNKSVFQWANWFAASFWVTVLLLDFSGVNRSEVGRLWIFLMPLAVVTAANECESIWPAYRRFWVGFMALAFVQALVMKFFVSVHGTVI